MTSRRNGRQPAKGRPRRQVHVTIDGELAGWEFTALADFPMAWLADMQSGDANRIINALDRVILEHNFPNDQAEIAESVGELDTADVGVITQELGEALKRLPPR